MLNKLVENLPKLKLLKMAGFLNSSIGKKFLMSLSGLFLILFLAVHATLNSLLLVGPEAYNLGANFMGTNPFVRVMEPILALGFIIHILYALWIEIYNLNKRGVKRYAMAVRRHQSTWSSRNMIWLGLIILTFLVIHLANFFWKVKFGPMPEVTYNGQTMHDTYKLVVSLFQTNIWIDILYIIGAIALGLHLHHALWSAFQTLGWSNDRWRKIWGVIGDIYAVIITLIFGLIPWYFYFTHPLA